MKLQGRNNALQSIVKHGSTSIVPAFEITKIQIALFPSWRVFKGHCAGHCRITLNSNTDISS